MTVSTLTMMIVTMIYKYIYKGKSAMARNNYDKIILLKTIKISIKWDNKRQEQLKAAFNLMNKQFHT